MADATITDLINRIKKEGDLNRNSGTNSTKAVIQRLDTWSPVIVSMERSLSLQTQTLDKIYSALVDQYNLSKDALLDQARKERTSQEPEIIPSNEQDAGPGQSGAQDDVDVPTDGVTKLLSLLSLGGLTAAAIGSTIGVVTGQIRAIRAFTPTSIIDALTDMSNGVTSTIQSIRTSITSRITSLGSSIGLVLNQLGDLFKIADDSPIGKAISSFRSNGVFRYIGDTLTRIVDVFTSASRTIEDIFSVGKNVATRFSVLGVFLRAFGSTVGNIAKVVGKVFAPIAIITTAWDTIKGTLEGYAEGGILGGLEGAITGFFNSLITIPLDLVTNAVAWVAEKLGFDETADVLRAFSFTEQFNKIVSSIFDGVSSAVNVIKDLFTFGEEDKTALGLLGKLTDLVYAPVNMAISFVRGLFGWEQDENAEPFRLNRYVGEQVQRGIDWARETFGEIGENIRAKFIVFGDYLTTIPDRIKLYAEEMFVNLKANIVTGFLRLARWIETIPDRISIAARERLPSWLGGITPEEATRQRNVLETAGEGYNAAIAQIESERASSLESIAQRRRALGLDQVEAAATPANQLPMQGPALPPSYYNNPVDNSVVDNSVIINQLANPATALDPASY